MSKSTISTFELFQMFPDQESARLYLESRLWPNGVICPTCRKGERITTRKGGYYRCNACQLDFTVRTGTIFERSHIPLHKWLAALHLFATEPKITIAKISDGIDVTMKTAMLVLQRIREAVPDDLSVDYIGIEGFPSYRVGSDGSVWSCAKGKQWHPLKPTPDKDGYNMVRLYAPDGWKQARVAVLICTAFHGTCPQRQEVRHLDGTRNNDAANNLCWGTSVENKADQIRHGTKLTGDRHHNTVLSESAIDQIRLLKGQRKQREVAAEFGTTQSYVSEIWSGRRRKEVSDATIYPMNEKIVDMYLEGKYSMADVGKAFGVSRQYVHQVLNKSKVEDRWLKYKNKDKADLAKYGEVLNELMERYRNGEYINPVVQELKIPSRIVNKFFHRTAEDILDHEVSKYARNLAPQPNGCIEWTGCYANGYPIHPVNSHDRSALKWGWFYANGEFVSVKNTCGNRRCVNIEHMEKRLVG